MNRPDADTLRAELFQAARDPATLEPFCRTHAALIRQHFASWRKLPDEIRDQPEAMRAYVDGLVAVANFFESHLGDPSLHQALAGPPGSNPIERWDAILDQARQEMNELRYDEASARLTDLAIDIGRLKGSAVDAYLPVVFGSLGECHFQSGRADRAVEPTRQALALVRKSGDAEGILAYLGNLYETHRYLGQAEPAAACADELATLYEQMGQPGQARRYRNQSRLVRAGEPLLRIVLDVSGQRYELDEVIKGVEGSVKFLFERNRLALQPSQVLTQQGEGEASQGRFDQALAFFREASEADPYNPQPVYEAGLTLLYLQRPSDAVEYYDRTEELAPGWFHCRSEGWLARQLATERYSHDIFLTLHNVQDGPLAPSVKMQLVTRSLAEAPDLALMHHLHGKLLAEAQQLAAAGAAFRRGLDCAEEPDIKTRLLVDLASTLDSDAERKELCRQARALNGNLVASATAALVLAFD
jgi:tetratricopeptide (TPR) repeat protein